MCLSFQLFGWSSCCAPSPHWPTIDAECRRACTIGRLVTGAVVWWQLSPGGQAHRPQSTSLPSPPQPRPPILIAIVLLHHANPLFAKPAIDAMAFIGSSQRRALATIRMASLMRSRCVAPSSSSRNGRQRCRIPTRRPPISGTWSAASWRQWTGGGRHDQLMIGSLNAAETAIVGIIIGRVFACKRCGYNIS